MAAGTIEFRLLGPVEVWAGEREWTGTWVRPRALLAALLLELNATVPVERLAEAVWDDKPPRTVRNSLQALVSQVRRALDAAGAGGCDVALRTEPGGYRLWADPTLVDVCRFRVSAAAFRAAAAVGDRRRAIMRGRDALREWRGVALAGLAGGWAARAREGMAREHVELLSHFFEVRLNDGEHTAVIDELQQAVSRYPLAEQLAGQLMLSLYRCGREAEAVDRYTAVRRSVARELGEEPGSALQELYQRILRRDPSLRAPAIPRVTVEPCGSGATAAGNQLPLGAADFTGRGALVDQTVARLIGSGAVVAISGMAGVGKTALALHVGHRLAPRFPDGQLFIGLGGTTGRPVPPREAAARLLTMLGVDPTDIPPGDDERMDRYRAVLGGRRVLFVFDDAVDEAHVRSILPTGAGSVALITSRRGLTTLECAWSVPLAVLDHDEAVSLLAAVAGDDRVAADPAAAERIVRLCGRLPLAIRIVGARLAARPHWLPRRLADLLADERRRLGELQQGDLAVRASFSLSYDGLDDRARRLFCGLGSLGPRSFPSWVAAMLVPDAGSGGAADPGGLAVVEEALDRLVDRQLLDLAGRDAAGRQRYRMHDLLAVFARERAGELAADRTRLGFAPLVGVWLNIFDATEAGFGQPHRHRYPLGWLPAQQRTLARITRPDSDTFWELGWPITFSTIAIVFELRSHWDSWRLTRDVAVRSAHRVGDRLRLDAGHYRLLPGQRHPWTPVVADMESALEGIEQPHWHGVILVTLGALYRAQARYEAAAEALGRAVEVFHDLRHRGWQAAALFSMASVHVVDGDLDAALRRYEECQDKLPDEDRALFTAYVDRAVGYACQQHGRYQQATDAMDRALAAFRSHDDSMWYDHTLLTLGYARLGLRDTEAAVGVLASAETALRRSGDRRGSAMALRALAAAERQRGDFQSAARLLEAGRQVFVELDDAIGQAVTTADLAYTHRRLARTPEARRYLRHATEMLTGTGLVRPGPPPWG
ncbi:MAG TPA: BTAD domain-containing putative transcriptional regulator [Micromonosporaceae bacterium]|nr:BTAD domain-containing putative transcriptional regulator [Micromonosporaceae bacterium]